MHRPMWDVQQLLQDCHTLCGTQRMAWQEQTAAKRNIPWIPHRRKVLPFRHNRRIFWSTLWRIPRYDMRSDSYPHQWGACRRPVISAGEEPGNHFPLLFRALHTAGNRGNVRTLPEYDRVSNPQDFTASAQRNGGAFAWRIRTFYLMKRLFGRPAGSGSRGRGFTALRKANPACRPWKRAYQPRHRGQHKTAAYHCPVPVPLWWTISVKGLFHFYPKEDIIKSATNRNLLQTSECVLLGWYSGCCEIERTCVFDFGGICMVGKEAIREKIIRLGADVW